MRDLWPTVASPWVHAVAPADPADQLTRSRAGPVRRGVGAIHEETAIAHPFPASAASAFATPPERAPSRPAGAPAGNLAAPGGTVLRAGMGPASASPLPLTLEVRAFPSGAGPEVAPDTHLVVVPAQKGRRRARLLHDDAPREVELGMGDLALVPAGPGPAWEWTDPAHVLLIRIDAEAVRPAGDVRVWRDCALAAMALRMGLVVQQDGPGGAAVLRALAAAFLALLQREGARAAGAAEPPRERLSPDRQRSLVEFVEANLGRRIAVSELAAVAGLSASALSRALRVSSGLTPTGLVARLRDDRARAMLDGGGATLAQVAAVCGYADQAHLTRRFKRAFGVTPSAYRKGARGASA